MAAFWVGGTPIPQGSSIVRVTRDGRPFLAPDNSAALKRWRRTIATVAGLELRDGYPLQDAAWVTATFYLEPPRTVRREFPTVKPDVDKLLRALLDALTGVAFRDDALVVHATAAKVYRSNGAGVHVGVGPAIARLDMPAEGTK